MEGVMKVSKIKGTGYMKFLFTGKFLDGKQISVIFWDRGGQSPAHNHSVNERTFVAFGRICETRRYGPKNYRSISYGEGTVFDVPTGTEHVVKAEMASVTLNVCAGPLSMDILDDFNPPKSLAH
jgi:quercetin dioxygenase-like cupin family protein